MQLVLSTFTGAGLLDMAFEQEGFCVVSLGDVIFGRDIREQHVPVGKFDGVIGGPPCQRYSTLARINRAQGKRIADCLIPEFERIVREAQPVWFLMENVPAAPMPEVPHYEVVDCEVRDCEVGGKTTRLRRFSFGTRDGRPLDVVPVFPFPSNPMRAITGDSRRASVGNRIRSKEKGGGVLPAMGTLLPLSEVRDAQGLPADFLAETPYTTKAIRQMLGNGVPLAMGRAIAKAVREAVA